MKFPSDWFSNKLNEFYSKYSKDVGSLIIITTVVGWIASSVAQCFGIVTNKKYTKEQKSFMLPQEIGDMAMNICSFLVVTTPIKLISKKLVKSGKILPGKLRQHIPNNFEVGNLNTDLSQIEDTMFSKPFNSFYNFVSTSSAVLGGVISSNILTPILRNKYASSRQSTFRTRIDTIENKKKQYMNKNENTTPYSNISLCKSPFNTIRTF